MLQKSCALADVSLRGGETAGVTCNPSHNADVIIFARNNRFLFATRFGPADSGHLCVLLTRLRLQLCSQVTKGRIIQQMAPTAEVSKLVGQTGGRVRSLGIGSSFGDGVEFEVYQFSAADQDPEVKDDQFSVLGGETSKMGVKEELEAVQAMWEALSEEERKALPDRTMLVRHYRAEKGNLKAGIGKLKAALEWRKEFGVVDIVNCMMDETDLAKIMMNENETGKIYVRGYDAEGRALMYMRPARENTQNELNNMRHLVWNLEKAIACTARKSVELGSILPVEKVNLVIDYEGFRLRDAPPLSTSKYTLDILQKHYPERLHRAYVLNPPMVFKTFWAIVRPFVDPSTKQKIIFCTGKHGMESLHAAVSRTDKLEAVACGTNPVRDFDSQEYLDLPFDVCFDE